MRHQSTHSAILSLLLTSWKQTYRVGSGIVLGYGLLGGSATAQITVDGTTPTIIDSTITGCAGTCITGGLRDGNNTGPNIFHSFSDFNVSNGQTVTFDRQSGVTNIFSRVTGLNASTIDGILSINGNVNDPANLFLLNPNGIIFGDNAQLSIPGSFLASTADSFLFEGSNTFSATAPATPSLLNINVPIGLQFGSGRPSIGIQVAGNGHALSYNSDATISRGTPSSGLVATNGQTLALIGGNVTIEGGNLVSDTGHVEVGSVGENSTVGFTDTASTTPSGWAFDYSNTHQFQDIALSQNSSIDVSGDDAGSAQLQGRHISIIEGSSVLAKTLTNGGGQITLNASEQLNLVGVELSATALMPTSAYIEIAPGAIGDGSSRLTVAAPQISLTAGAQIGLGIAGGGTSGSVDVTAQSIIADNGSADTFSGFYTAVLTAFSPPFGPPPGAIGQGGDLNITTEQLTVSNGAQLVASTFGPGNAGNLTIQKATDIEVIGFNAGGASSIRSTSEVPVLGPPNFPPLLPAGSGNGGKLDIQTERLLVANGGQVAVSTVSTQPAGNITINASESVELRGQTSRGRSGLFATSTFGSGAGGNIQVNTSDLSLLDGATINASNFSSFQPGPPPGVGAAGNINLSAENILLVNDSLITTDTVSGDRANITLDSDSLVLRNSSNITTNATGTATGGNLYIDTSALIALENSDITANAENNFGGRVVVNAETILGTAYREQITAESDITASSALGPSFSGSVELNSPEGDPTDGITALPAGLVANDQIVAACEQLDSNTFVATGREGLPEDASQLITGQSIWNDFRFINRTAITSNSEPVSVNNITTEIPTINFPVSNSTPEATPEEAQDWTINQAGEIVLVTRTETPTTALHSQTNCLANT